MYYNNDSHDFYYRFCNGLYHTEMAKIDKITAKKLTSILIDNNQFKQIKKQLKKSGWYEYTTEAKNKNRRLLNDAIN